MNETAPKTTENKKPHFFDFTQETFKDFIKKMGLKPFRAKQIMEWVYDKKIANPLQMTNLSKFDQTTTHRKSRLHHRHNHRPPSRLRRRPKTTHRLGQPRCPHAGRI